MLPRLDPSTTDLVSNAENYFSDSSLLIVMLDSMLIYDVIIGSVRSTWRWLSEPVSTE